FDYEATQENSQGIEEFPEAVPEKEVLPEQKPIEESVNETVDVDVKRNEYGMPYYRAFDSNSYVICSDLKNPYALADLITDVVRIEQPVHFEVLCRRIAPILGYVHVNSELIDHIDNIISNYASTEIVQSNEILYIDEPRSETVRCSKLGSPDRELRYIPLTEIKEAVRIVMSDEKCIARARLNNIIGQIFGYSRLTSLKDKNIISEVVDDFKAEGLILREMGMLRWMED
ncbi:MAG: hypothetical protein MJ110_04595, partial [Lachnospiraceae bacterium]|nr:hypothetical protein [Lachnospiraceae bacterium]